ncbi:hypothetical protein GIB67_027285 [Kingdonia uniflora]|uniref:Expansin-like B1 n=1 Tax=Kingdonia uniflora TaxID=39325 RepID=A0A7J7KYH2_9MAGN|nr:hypothetical protein GIB67_027285 [Kingdonia uniflora]
MGHAFDFSSCILCFLFLLPTLCFSQDTYTCSRATFYDSHNGLGTTSGACGFGEFGRKLKGGNVGAVSKLYRNGTGCGACYQVRCTIPQLCTHYGVKVVVTDHGEGDHTDFVLSPHGFTKLARPNLAGKLMAHGVVNIEYKRISCKYPGHNLMFKVHEHSKFPNYLAIVFLYQAGQKDVVAVELWQEDSQEWRGMRKAYGGVWDMASPPRGDLKLRFQVSGVDGQQWVQVSNAIRSNWKAGVAYDSGIQF